MSPSPEEPVSTAVAGGVDAGFVISDEVRAVAGSTDAGFAPPGEIGAAKDGESADCVASFDIAGVPTGLLCAGSASESGRSGRGEDFSRAFGDAVCGSRL